MRVIDHGVGILKLVICGLFGQSRRVGGVLFVASHRYCDRITVLGPILIRDLILPPFRSERATTIAG